MDWLRKCSVSEAAYVQATVRPLAAGTSCMPLASLPGCQLGCLLRGQSSLPQTQRGEHTDLRLSAPLTVALRPAPPEQSWRACLRSVSTPTACARLRTARTPLSTGSTPRWSSRHALPWAPSLLLLFACTRLLATRSAVGGALIEERSPPPPLPCCPGPMPALICLLPCFFPLQPACHDMTKRS